MGFFLADFFQLARVEPVTAAIRTVIHFDLFPGTEEMPEELHVFAAGTGAFAGEIHDYARIALDAQEMLAGHFALLVDALQFEGIEPNSSTTPVAAVHLYAAHFHFRQVEITGWAFHG